MVLSSFYKRGNSESKRMMNNKLHRVSGAQTQLCPILKPQGISVVHVWACLYQGIHFLFGALPGIPGIPRFLPVRYLVTSQ